MGVVTFNHFTCQPCRAFKDRKQENQAIKALDGTKFNRKWLILGECGNATWKDVMEEALRSTPSAQDPAQLVASRAPRDDERRVALLVLCLLALFIGVMTGFGAVALRALIGLIHNGFYNGVFNFRYDANILEGPSPFGDFVIFRQSSAA